MPTFLIPSKKGTKMKQQRIGKTNSLSKLNKEEERIRRIKQARIEQIQKIELAIEGLMEGGHGYTKINTEGMIEHLIWRIDYISGKNNTSIS